MANKITAPHSYDPGKRRPKEYLAYLNEREMAYLRSINGNNTERGPRGLPSFPPKDAIGSSSNAPSKSPASSGVGRDSSRGIGQGAGGAAVGRGPSGGSPSGGGNLGGGGKSAPGSSPSSPGGLRGAGGNYGPGSGRPGTTSSTGGGYKGPSSPMSGQGPSYSKDTEAQQNAQVRDAIKAVKNSPAFRNDASSGGIRTLSVGPIGTPVNVGPSVTPTQNRASVVGGWGVQAFNSAMPKAPSLASPMTAPPGYRPKDADQIQRSLYGLTDKQFGELGKGYDERIPASDTYKPSAKALSAVSRGPGSVSGSMPGNTDPVAAQRSLQAITNSLNETFGKNYTPEEINKIAKTIAGEAAGESTFGQAAVANTMLNRISLASQDPEKYGYMGGRSVDSLLGQYDASGMRKGTSQNAAYKSSVPGTESYRKAMNALSEASNPTGQFAKTASPEVLASTHYYNPKDADPKWGTRSGNSFETVGAHVFGNAEPTQRAVREARNHVPASATPGAGSTASGEYNPVGSITSAYNKARDLYNSMPSFKDINEGYADIQKNLDAYRQAKTGPLSPMTGPIADARLKEAVTGYASQGIQALKDLISPSAAQAGTPSGPIMSGNKATVDTINKAEDEKILEVENVPESTVGPDEVYGPRNVSPEVQELMKNIEKKNKYGTKIAKAAPIVGPAFRLGDSLRDLFTGKNTAEADADLKRAYMQGSPAQQAELETKYPNLTKFAQQAGLEPRLPMSNYESWRQRSFGTGGGGGGSTSTTSPGGGITDIGSGGKNEPPRIEQAEKEATKPKPKPKEDGRRPAIYYKWDLGVDVPSPTDSDYTLYLKYLQEKAAAKAGMAR